MYSFTDEKFQNSRGLTCNTWDKSHRKQSHTAHLIHRVKVYNLPDNNARWLFFYNMTELCRALQHRNRLSAASLKHSAHKYVYFQFDGALSQPNPFACNGRALVNKAQHGTHATVMYIQYIWLALQTAVIFVHLWGRLAIIGCTEHLARHGRKRGKWIFLLFFF